MSIYSRFTPDDIVEANPTLVTTGIFSNDVGTYEDTLFYGNNDQVAKEYYIEAYNKSSSDATGEVQFAVAYGHINGGGAPGLVADNLATLPTKAIYRQYKNLLLDPTDNKFSFQGIDSDHIYVINFQRSRYRDQLDPGNWELPLSGSKGFHTFIDDSGQTLGALTANSKAGRVFNVISGSISSADGLVTSSANSTRWQAGGPGYGLVYPDLGIIVLNPNAIGPAVGFAISSSAGVPTSESGSVMTSSLRTPPYTDAFDAVHTDKKVYAPFTHSLTETEWKAGGSTVRKGAYNHVALINSLNLAVSSSDERGFQARSAETITSTHYFVRLRNKEFNYSNNPTFYNADNGSLTFTDFKNNPQSYITTVGLYNDQNELLAVAKLSKPVRKSFDEEVLLRVRLDF